jgi:hypothetical protein
MRVNIDDPIYSTLKKYTVLSATGLTTANTTTITNGFYGSHPAASYTGPFVGTVDSANASTAKTELTAFRADIEVVRLSFPTTITLGIETTNITLYPDTNYTSGSEIRFEGKPITLDARGDSNAQFIIKAYSKITFNNVPSITLSNGALNCNVFWVTETELIKFTGTSPPNIPGFFIAGSAITFENASQISGRLYAKDASITFDGPSGTNSVNAICTTSNDNFIICYLKGTLILTKQGLVPIENIKAGHSVVTKGKIYRNSYINPNDKIKIEPVMWISKFRVTNLNSKSRPICIKKDALGKNYPFQDLYVSPGHSLLLDSKMVLAKDLVNGRTIYQDRECENVEYYHLECDRHSAIFANGVLSESFFEANNRHVFENSIRLPSNFNLKKMLSLR